MTRKRLTDNHQLTGAILGAVIGLCFPLDAYKGMLVILAAVTGFKLVSTR
jgi:hypothetical protein